MVYSPSTAGSFRHGKNIIKFMQFYSKSFIWSESTRFLFPVSYYSYAFASPEPPDASTYVSASLSALEMCTGCVIVKYGNCERERELHKRKNLPEDFLYLNNTTIIANIITIFRIFLSSLVSYSCTAYFCSIILPLSLTAQNVIYYILSVRSTSAGTWAIPDTHLLPCHSLCPSKNDPVVFCTSDSSSLQPYISFVIAYNLPERLASIFLPFTPAHKTSRLLKTSPDPFPDLVSTQPDTFLLGGLPTDDGTPSTNDERGGYYDFVGDEKLPLSILVLLNPSFHFGYCDINVAASVYINGGAGRRFSAA